MAEEIRRQQARDVARQHQHLGAVRAARDAHFQHAEGDERVGRLGGGAAQELDARQELSRQRQVIGGGRVGLGGGDEQAAQLGVITGLSGEHRRAPRRLSDQPGAQVDAAHAHDGALDLVAVREQQLAQRAARRFARARPAQAGDNALLPLQIEGVEARDDGGRRPVAERAFEHVDGAAAPARPALLAERVRLLGPANHLIEAIAPVADLGRHRRERRQRQRDLLGAPARREHGDDQLGSGTQQALVSFRDAGRGAPQLRGIVERERLAERLEDDVVDVVVLENRGLRGAARRDSGPALGRAGSAAARIAGRPVRWRWPEAPGTPDAPP